MSSPNARIDSVYIWVNLESILKTNIFKNFNWCSELVFILDSILATHDKFESSLIRCETCRGVNYTFLHLYLKNAYAKINEQMPHNQQMLSLKVEGHWDTIHWIQTTLEHFNEGTTCRWSEEVLCLATSLHGHSHAVSMWNVLFIRQFLIFFYCVNLRKTPEEQKKSLIQMNIKRFWNYLSILQHWYSKFSTDQ